METHVRKRLEGTTEEFYPSLAECVAAVEAGIFEHPQRQETHDFIFRVRSWEWDIDSLTPDLHAMEASLEAYCQRQFMGRRAANACELMVDEIISNQLLNVARSRGIANPATHVTFTAGEGGVDMVMTVDYRAVMTNGTSPDQGDWDVLSKAIVESYCDHWEMLEPGIVRLYIHA